MFKVVRLTKDNKQLTVIGEAHFKLHKTYNKIQNFIDAQKFDLHFKN